MIRLPIPNRVIRIGYEHFVLPGQFRRGDFALLHCPAYILPYRFSGKCIVTVHDTIALDFPEFCKNSNALYFGMLLKRSIRRASHIIAVSERVKQDILCQCDIDPGKITTIYHGIDPIFKPLRDEVCKHVVREKYELPERYLLFVGNVEPKKNLSRLIRAYALFKKRTGSSHNLVVAGQLAWKYGDVLKTRETLGLGDCVQLLHYIDREDLPALYSMANLFVFPSLYEGFGLPPLEAMACGAPVMVSREGALPEVTGGHCFYTDAYSEEDMADQMEKILTNPLSNASKIASGIEHTRNLTWEKTWEKTLNIYKSTI